MKEHNSKIDYLRCVACIAVVTIHAVAIFGYNTPVPLLSITEYLGDLESSFSQNIVKYQTMEWNYCAVLDAFSRFSVPIFVMISGALMLNRDELENTYIRRKVTCLVKLIITWGGVQGGIYMVKCLMTYEPIDGAKLLRMVIKGPGAFWFLYMIIPIYFTAPVLKEILKRKELSRYFLLLWIVFGLLASTFKLFFSSFQELPQLEYLNCVPVYVGYFFLGGYLEKYSVSKRNKYFICVLGIISVIIMVFGKPAGYFHNFTTPMCAIYSTAVYVIFSDLNFSSNLISRGVKKFANLTIGIYAMHGFALSAMRRLWKPCIKYIIVQVPIYIILSICMCAIATIVLKRIRFLESVV